MTSLWWGRWFVAPFALSFLLSLAFCYVAHDPILPHVHVRWSGGVSLSQRVALEAAYGLSEPEHTEGTTWSYSLTDTSTENIQRLVHDPAADDTHLINRATFELTEPPPAPLLILLLSLAWSGIVGVTVASIVATAALLQRPLQPGSVVGRYATWAAETRAHLYCLMALVILATSARFFFLERSPPGFYLDEAAISAQVICLRQSGADLSGIHWPVFTEVVGGGYATAPYLYSGVAWTAVFGDSVSSFRGMVASSSVLFVLGSFVLGLRFWHTKEAAWLCALAAALSPWAFQFSRIAWDPGLSPALSVWAFALLWASGRAGRTQAAVGGLLLSLAAYSYPPLRVQLVIAVPIALYILFVKEGRDWKRGALFVTTAVLLSVPLMQATLGGEIQGRFRYLSVFNPQYLSEFGEPSIFLGLTKLIEHFGLNFSGGYLLVSGDANIRHSTLSYGLWGWLDVLGVVIALSALVVAVKQKAVNALPWSAIVFIVVGYVAGVLPAAMTSEGNPHALRSLGAVVFLALGVGGALQVAWRDQRVRGLREGVLVVSALFLFLLIKTYAVTYPGRAYSGFDTEVLEVAQRLGHQGRILDLESELTKSGVAYAPMAIRYYELAAGAVRCPLEGDL